MSYLRNSPFNEKDFPAFTAMREQIGFLPNFYVAQTSRPDLIEAEVALMGTILLKDGGLSRKQKEYIFLVASAANPERDLAAPWPWCRKARLWLPYTLGNVTPP